MRIAKYLASCGLGSRRKSEELIAQGKISVNDKVVTDPSFQIDLETDKVCFDNKLVKPNRKVYYLLNKPIGYTSSTSDKHAKKLVTELIPSEPSVWPVGRLDRETAGLLILTNDGDLTQKLTHPSYEKSKEYSAVTDRALTEKEVNELILGIELDDGPIKPDEFKIIGNKKYQVTIHEGRNRIVRRIFEYFGAKVIDLTRLKLSFLTLENLPIGEFRTLSDDEVERLKNG